MTPSPPVALTSVGALGGTTTGLENRAVTPVNPLTVMLQGPVPEQGPPGSHPSKTKPGALVAVSVIVVPGRYVKNLNVQVASQSSSGAVLETLPLPIPDLLTWTS